MKPGLSNTEPNYSDMLKAMKTVVICCVLGFVLAYYRGLSVTNVLLVIIAVIIAFFLGILALQIAQITAILGGKDGLDLRRLLNKVEDIRRMIAERDELDGIEDQMDAKRDAILEDAAKHGSLPAYLDHLRLVQEVRQRSEEE
jgi:low affinity Fe/Cu permease